MSIGRYVSAQTPNDHFVSVSVLTVDGIMEKRQLSVAEFAKIEDELKNMNLLDTLIHFPDSPRYDVALFLIAMTR
jgi:hypothetical protein